MKFFKTKREARNQAMKLKMTGLTGSGQQCGPEWCYRGWFYRTAHNVFDGEPVGDIILPERILSGEEASQFMGWLAGYEECPV